MVTRHTPTEWTNEEECHTKCWAGARKNRAPYTAGGDAKRDNCFGKQAVFCFIFWQFLYQLNMTCHIIQLLIQFLGIHSWEKKDYVWIMPCTWMFIETLHNSQELETTQMYIHNWTNKESRVYLYHRIKNDLLIHTTT